MRQYGSPRGNDYESEREFKAASARAREKRIGVEEIAEELQAYEDDDDYMCYPW